MLHLPDMSRTVDQLPTESQDDLQSTHANLQFEFEFDLNPLRLWWKIRTWNYYKTIELSLNVDMIYQMKKNLLKWIYSNQNILTICLTDTSVLYSVFLLILCFVCFPIVLFLEWTPMAPRWRIDMRAEDELELEFDSLLFRSLYCIWETISTNF